MLKGGYYSEAGKPDLAINNYLKAIELNRNWNWSSMMAGFVYCQLKNDFIHGIPYIERAITLKGRNPSQILNLSGQMYLHLGAYNKAIEYYKKSIALRLECYGNIRGYFWLLASQGKLGELQDFTDSICAMIDCSTECARLQFQINYTTKEYDQAEIYFNEFIEAGGSPHLNDSVHIAFVYRKLGKEKEAMAIVEKIISTYDDQLISNSNDLVNYTKHIPYNLSSVYALLNDREKACKYLTKAADRGFHSGAHDFIEIDPVFENLRDDPEFTSIVKRAQEEKAAIRAQISEMRENGELNF